MYLYQICLFLFLWYFFPDLLFGTVEHPIESPIEPTEPTNIEKLTTHNRCMFSYVYDSIRYGNYTYKVSNVTDSKRAYYYEEDIFSNTNTNTNTNTFATSLAYFSELLENSTDLDDFSVRLKSDRRSGKISKQTLIDMYRICKICKRNRYR